MFPSWALGRGIGERIHCRSESAHQMGELAEEDCSEIEEQTSLADESDDRRVAPPE